MSDLFSSVNINSSFQRSARIDNKISSEFLDHFVFHDTSKKVLNQISSSLLNSNQSGFTLTGPYGTGKSSLALFLKALISKESVIKKQAENIAKFSNKHLFARVFLNKKSWFTLNVIGSRVVLPTDLFLLSYLMPIVPIDADFLLFNFKI